jgi:hypothetical protein
VTLEHPNFNYLEKILIPIISKRKYRGWAFSGLKYDPWAQQYHLFLNKEGTTKELTFYREWLDRLHDQGDSFLKFRFKKVLRETLGIEEDERDSEED